MSERPSSYFSAPTDLVGRSAELRWLSSALRDARSGQPRVVFVVGEGGLGKSRLLLDLQERARRDGVQVLSGRGQPDLVLPRRLLGEVLRPALQALRGERRHEADLALALLEGAASIERSDHGGDVGDPAHWLAIQALESCVVEMARRRPLMLCLDDLHWSDRPSLELLTRILHAGTEAARQSPLPLFIVCGSRPLGEGAALQVPLERLRREEGVRVLELGGLAPDSVAELMQSSGLPRGARRLATSVHELTRGNPLFVIEVTRHMARHGAPALRAGDEDLPLPASIGDALEGRLASLDVSTRDLLARAACLGGRFSLATLSRVTGLETGELVTRLEQGRAEGLLVADGPQLAFAHPLLRHALYGREDDLRRHHMHLEIADALARSDGEPAGPRLLEIAHHLVRAGPLAERERVARMARRAGDHASAIWAPAEAAGFYAAALDAGADVIPVRERGELHERASVACYRAADAERARAHAAQAIDAFQRVGDAAGIARARVAAMRVEITLDPLPYGTLADVEPLEKALGDLPGHAVRLRGQILQVLSGAYWTAQRTRRAVQCARDARRVGRDVGDAQLESEAGSALSLAYTQTLELEAALEAGYAAVEAARSVDDAWREGTALTRVPLVHFYLGDVARAESMARQAEECARRTQDWTNLSVALSVRLSIAAARGELARARELAAELRQLAARSGYPWGAFGGLRSFVGAAFEGGEREEAEETLNLLGRPGGLFREPGATAVVCWVYRQRMLVDRGIPVNLREPLRAAMGARAPSRAPELGALSTLCAVVLIARAMEEPSLAEVPRQLLELAHERGVRLTGGWVHVLPRILGIAASLAGESDRAEAWLEEAEQVAQGTGATVELAHTWLEQARLAAARGDTARARRRAARARACYTELCMQGHEHRAAQLVTSFAAGGGEIATEEPVETESRPRETFDERGPGRFLREFLAHLDESPDSEPDAAAPGRPEARERDAVILMTDMVGSTERLGRRGERAALDVMQRHNAILRGCLSETGGIEVQHTGDGIFACFDDADQAIACAARIQQAFARRSARDEDPIEVRIGVSAGPVVPVEDRLFGSAVNLAARICAWAAPGHVVVSGDVRGRGDGAGFSFRDLGPVELKGFSDPLRLHEVVW